jgi:hypothetical protein
MKKNTENKKLFLDDVRQVRDAANYMPNPKVYNEGGWDIVRSYTEFVNYLKSNPLPELISFDHDLADIHYEVDFRDWNDFTSEQLGVEETGMDCAKFLVKHCRELKEDLPTILVHSANPVGRTNIRKYLENAAKHIDFSKGFEEPNIDDLFVDDDINEFPF